MLPIQKLPGRTAMAVGWHGWQAGQMGPATGKLKESSKDEGRRGRCREWGVIGGISSMMASDWYHTFF